MRELPPAVRAVQDDLETRSLAQYAARDAADPHRNLSRCAPGRIAVVQRCCPVDCDGARLRAARAQVPRVSPLAPRRNDLLSTSFVDPRARDLHLDDVPGHSGRRDMPGGQRTSSSSTRRAPTPTRPTRGVARTTRVSASSRSRERAPSRVSRTPFLGRTGTSCSQSTRRKSRFATRQPPMQRVATASGSVRRSTTPVCEAPSARTRRCGSASRAHAASPGCRSAPTQPAPTGRQGRRSRLAVGHHSSRHEHRRPGKLLPLPASLGYAPTAKLRVAIHWSLRVASSSALTR